MKLRFSLPFVVVAIVSMLCWPVAAQNSIPYSENFEGFNQGDSMFTQTGWAGDTNGVAIVTNLLYSYAGTYPIPGDHFKVLYVDGSATNSLSGPSSVPIWSDFMGLLGQVENTNIAVDINAQLAFYVNTNSHLVLWHADPSSNNRLWTEFPDTLIGSSQWVRITIKCDYNNIDGNYFYPYFQILLNGVALTNQAGWTSNDGFGSQGGNWFALTRTDFSTMTNLVISGKGWVDDLVVTTNAPSYIPAEGWSLFAVTVPGNIAYGSVTPTNVLVPDGGSTNFEIAASNYYHISSITTNSIAIDPAPVYATGFTYTNFVWPDIHGSGTLRAYFAPDLTVKGTPHWWLASYGLTNNFETDDDADVDADGHKAWQEYVTGTDPTNTLSVLHVAEQVIVNGTNTLTWESSLNGPALPYAVQRTPDLVNGPWTQIATVPRSLPSNSWTGAASGTNAFYRIVATNNVP